MFSPHLWHEHESFFIIEFKIVQLDSNVTAIGAYIVVLSVSCLPQSLERAVTSAVDISGFHIFERLRVKIQGDFAFCKKMIMRKMLQFNVFYSRTH